MISTSELRPALAEALARHPDTPGEVEEIARRPSPYRSSFGLEEVSVSLDDGTRLELIFKDLGWDGLSATGRDAKPRFLYEPLREIEVYRRILTPEALGTATYYGSVVDPGVGRFWLFLERVAGVELYDVGELARWEDAARWLGAMHSRFADRAGELVETGHLIRHDASYYRPWIGRAREFAAEAGCSEDELASIEWLAERHGRIVDELLALPPTVIHGEFYASNVLVGGPAVATRVCPIDWEVAAVGPGLIDLAALTEGWPVDGREALEGAYREALREPYAWNGGGDSFDRALAVCRLQLAIQWLGWAPRRWSPPPDHRQDWLGTAMRLAADLEL